MDASTARRFPLIARPRPACTPLPQRIADLHTLADKATSTGDLATATAVFNLAALIASDCGAHDLARHWCHRLAHATLSRPHPDRNALEPIVNLARLRIRAADGTTAWTILETLHQAVTDRTTVTIDGITITTADLTPTGDAHQELRQWVWTVLLGTGAHALASADRWDEARQRLEHHHGIGQRMLDGRQIAVISHILAGRTNRADHLLRTTVPGEPWENAVTGCLNLLCPHTDRADTSQLHRRLEPEPGQLVFWTRLQLSLIDAAGIEQPEAATLALDLLHHAHRDGYAARDVLAHPGCRKLATAEQVRSLRQVVRACGLDRGRIPTESLAQLNRLLIRIEQVIRSPRPRTVTSISGNK
ncbi:hypothetical protein [Actinoplanes sp. L3-i22]|uniref:hypothetical protein n=1 Tax=Actinoplanes sp. L3-i22 TaxID=2836373 RepID=UPI001C785EC0|nr:hypothetical protein [Actinoplanes sp. L3-i22]BCY07291.1 hypothetical protein L3i22_023790 [Actinoplanes sp. L3-i22]